MRIALLFFLCFLIISPLTQMTPSAQTQTPIPKPPDTVYLLKPAHVFDGESAQLHDGWVVMVRGEKIEAVGPATEIIFFFQAEDGIRDHCVTGVQTCALPI